MDMGGTVTFTPSRLDNAVLIGVGGALVFYYIFKPEIPLVSNALDSAKDIALSPLDYTGTVMAFTARGLRNNNPGNIRWNSVNNWQGQTGRDSAGYATFDEMENGIRAMARLLQNYMKTGRNTVRAIITSWAPSNENNTESYIRAVSRSTGFSETQILNPSQGVIIALMKAITRHENGFDPIKQTQYEEGFRRAN